ncbi:site-specific integrase [candidate division KSB3 bacterium]|uniref:Site-specific integrase n=1 Tax=candidate division KSB3 bacterium TaxID=2044937 RepID=A0A2G6E0F2_9BACT|nr:MAG: site-specific integrase [candidate division KSB3 bacterium]
MGRGGIYTGIEARGESIRITFQYKGRRRRETLRIKPTSANMKYAARLRDTILYEIGVGSFNYANHFPNSRYANDNGLISTHTQSTTFAEMAGRWLNSRAHGEIAKGTLIKYRQALSSTWLPLFKDRDMTQIKYSELLETIGTINWKSTKTRNNALIPLRQIFDMAYRDGLLPSDPMVRIKNLKVQRVPPDPLSQQEAERIIGWIHRRDQQAGNYYQCSFYTGMRPEEMIALQWGDYDCNRQTIRVERARSYGEDKTVKNEKVRDIDLTPQAISAIEAQKPFTFLAGRHIFHNPRTGQPWDDQDKQRINFWNPALKKLGIRHRRAYETRHTYATMMLMAGCNPAYAASQMGHSLQMFFSIYARWIREREDKKEQEKLRDFLGDAPLMSQEKHHSTK